jgi:zinc transporter ZupT
MIYQYKGFPIPMMSLNFFYKISIMFHIDAMICHSHSAKVTKLKATNSNDCKTLVSPYYTLLVYPMVDYVPLWMGGYFDFGDATFFLGFVSLTLMIYCLHSFFECIAIFFLSFVFLLIN